MPRQSEIPFDEQVESIRCLLRAGVRSGASDGHFDNVCYQLIFSLPSKSTCITHRRYESDAGITDEDVRSTGDHIYPARPWGLVLRRRPELLDSLDTFLPFADELRTVCRCMSDENEAVKERSRTGAGLPRSCTRDLYTNCGIVTYMWSVNYKRTTPEPAFHDVPDFMHELETDILGWV